MEMKIDFRSRLDLRKAAAGSAALHAEDGAERRFARRNHRALADMREPLRQSDRCDGFAFTGNGGRGRGDEDHFPRGLANAGSFSNSRRIFAPYELTCSTY